MDDIVEIVNRILEEDGEAKYKNNMGNILLEAIRKREVDKTKKTKVVVEPQYVLSEELDPKVHEMKAAYDMQDFVWIPYEYWGQLGIKFQQLLTEVAEPLFFGGVSFRYSKFLEHKETLLRTIAMGTTLYLMKDADLNYRMMGVGANDYEPTMNMGVMEKAHYMKWFYKNMITGWSTTYIIGEVDAVNQTKHFKAKTYTPTGYVTIQRDRMKIPASILTYCR